MNPVTTTEGAPVDATTTTETTPAPVKVKATRKTATPVIARRKVLMGKHQKSGAPKLEVIGLTKNLRRGPFCLKDIFAANGETVSLLTIKKRKNELLKAGKLCKMARDFQQNEGSGRPPEFFNFDLTKGEVKKVRARKPKAAAPIVAAETTTETPAPVIPAEPAATIVELPAPAVEPTPAQPEAALAA